jgi:hypothetical protein
VNSDFRALCAAMSSWWGLLALPEWARPQDQAEFDELGRQARAALAAEPAEPAGEVPSERDVAEWINSLPLWHGASRDELTGIVLRAFARWGCPAAPPAPEPETLAESLAARPLLEKVTRLGDCIGQQTVAQVRQLAEQAAAWLRDHPPGQPVAIEPRGCPAPGACSCVEPIPPAPEVGEVEGLVAWMRSQVAIHPAAQTQWAKRFLRIATLLQQLAAPAPVVVPVAVSERLPGGGDCDAEGRCWAFTPRSATPFPNWTLIWRGHMQPYHTHWRPASAIPLPHAGEVEG